MRRTAMVLCLIAYTGAAVAAETANTNRKSRAPKVPSLEKFSCRTGPNDHQARLVVVVVKGRPMEFAYYSRLGTGVCSIHGRRGDAYTEWEDQPGAARVKLIEGSAMLEYKPGHLKLRFADVGRMVYCGMLGELNGSIEVWTKKSECTLDGVFD